MRRLPKLVAVFVLVGLSTVLSAAPGDGATEPPAAPTNRRAKAEVLSVEEMRAQSATIRTDLDGDLRHVLALRERTKREKDIIKLNCVNEQLLQIKAKLNIVDTVAVQLEGNLTKDDPARVDLFVELQTSADTVKELREKANACVGDVELFKQEAGVTVVHPDFPDDPIGENPFDPSVVEPTVEPPGYASPFN